MAFVGPAVNRGYDIPLKKPRTPSYLRVFFIIVVIGEGEVCCLSFIVSRGCPTIKPHIPAIGKSNPYAQFWQLSKIFRMESIEKI